MDQGLRVNSPRQLYKPYFGSTQRPSSPGLLAANGVEQIGDTVSLVKRGIELPQESDMGVRMIDVAPADREWDRRVILSGIINRYYWTGFLQVKGSIDTGYGTKGVCLAVYPTSRAQRFEITS